MMNVVATSVWLQNESIQHEILSIGVNTWKQYLIPEFFLDEVLSIFLYLLLCIVNIL